MGRVKPKAFGRGMNQQAQEPESDQPLRPEVMAILNNQLGKEKWRGFSGKGKGRGKPMVRGPPIYAFCSKDEQEQKTITDKQNPIVPLDEEK